MKLSSTYKGLITGVLMIAISMGIYYYKGNFENSLQYITYTVYVAGIIWALINYSHKADGSKTFKNLFSEGFKCFIVVTLLMVAFTWVFTWMNPSLKEEMAVNVRAEKTKGGNYTPAEIDTMVNRSKEYFIIMLTSIAIFGYLLIGSMVTLIVSLFLKKHPSLNGQKREI